MAHGIASTVDEERVLIGSAHFIFEDEGCVIPEDEQERFDALPPEYSHLYLAVGGQLAAVICISDPLRAEAKDAIRKTEFRTDVIGSNTRLAGASLEMIDLPGREGRLRKALAEVQKDYDFIFIDCPPSLDLLTLNGLSACDSVLIPVQCEYYALEGLSELISTLKTIRKKYNPYLDIEGVVFTMFSLRYNLTVQVVEQVQKYFGSKVYKTTIPRSIRISEAPSYGQPINFYEPKGKGSEAYMDLAIEFVKHNRPQEPKKSRAKAAPAAEPAKNALED